MRGLLIFGAGAVIAVLGSAAASRVPPCDNLPAAERERARLEGRCEGRAPIVELGAKGSARGDRAPVPDLRGRPFNRADARLARFVVAVDYRPSAHERDWVLDQRPRAPAALSFGSAFTVVLSDGTLVRVPNVRGGLARALALLHRAGLDWSAPASGSGSVVGQAPAAGAEVRRGTTIALKLAPGPVALAPESARPDIAPPPARPTAPPATAPPSTAPPASSVPPQSAPTTPARNVATTVNVPNVSGMIFDAARERLSGLTVERVHRAGVEPGGTVIGQSPAAGIAVAAGTSVRLVLSDGSLVRVPRVAGLALNEAKQRLAGSELKIVVSNVAGNAPSGTVLNQRPADGEIAARGSTVRVNVSNGPAVAAALTVPNVVGIPFDRAQSQLTRFRIERSERGAREAAGTVLEQNPAAGATLPEGSAISIIVSSGGRPEAIEVPNVVSQPINDATAALSEFRVERESVASLDPAGSVLAQEPAAGASVAPGSTVRVRVSDGSLVKTPALTQLRLAQARGTAQASGLTVDAGADADDAARVMEQQPAAGAPVPRGSAVRVTLQASQFALDPALDNAWRRARDFAGAAPPFTWALGGLALLLLALLLLLTRRRRVVALIPTAIVEPTLEAPAEPSSVRGEPVAAPPAAAVVPPAAEQPRNEVHARFEIDPLRTVARNAAPRGPEIGVRARLQSGAFSVRDLAAAPNEQQEPSEENR